MGLLAAMVSGGASGVKSHWQDVREDLQREAAQKFQMRLQERGWERQDEVYQQKRQDTQADLEKQREAAREQAKAQRQQELQDRQWERAAELEDYRTKKQIDAQLQPADGRWMDVQDAQGNIINQRNTKTGALKWSAKDRGSSGSGFEPNLEPLSMGNDVDYPNTWVDTRSGYVVDPQGNLLEPTVSAEQIKTQVDAEIEKRRGGMMGFLEKNDTEAFGGLTEEEFRERETNRLMRQAPTVADKIGIGSDRVLRSEDQLNQVYARQQSAYAPPSGIGMLSQASQMDTGRPAGNPTSGRVTIPENAFSGEDVPEQSENQPQQADEAEQPNENRSQQQGSEPSLTDEERALLDEFNLTEESADTELNQRMRNPLANANPVGAIRDTFTENAPMTSRALGRISEIPSNLSSVGMGLLSKAGSAIAEQHRQQVAAMDEYKGESKKQAEKALIEDFFGGKPTPDAARVVVNSRDASAKQKKAAQAYLKMQGEI